MEFCKLCRSIMCVRWCICACKIEKELKSEISAVERQTGRNVKVEGKPFDVYVRQQWDDFHTAKEMEKQQRVCSLYLVKDTHTPC